MLMIANSAIFMKEAPNTVLNQTGIVISQRARTTRVAHNKNSKQMDTKKYTFI